MHRRAGMTLAEIAVVVGVLVVVVVLAVVVLFGPGDESRWGNPRRCMRNLSSIGRAIQIYRSENDDAYPWLYDTITDWDTTEVGTNRNVSPFGANDDPNNPKRRSVTSLMFMLVRMQQDPRMFQCPQDKTSTLNWDAKAVEDDGDVRKGEYYWDFAEPENVSYSWQAPRYVNATTYANGVDVNESKLAVVADMTPAATNPGWKPADVSKLDDNAIAGQLGPNHDGKQVYVLWAAGDVQPLKRPDVGNANDNIYTAFGTNFKNRRSATSLDIRQHLRKSDTFLIGPVGRKAE